MRVATAKSRRPVRPHSTATILNLPRSCGTFDGVAASLIKNTTLDHFKKACIIVANRPGRFEGLKLQLAKPASSTAKVPQTDPPV